MTNLPEQRTGRTALAPTAAPTAAPTDRGEVVVGSDGTWHSHSALTRAAAEAAVRGLPLTVLSVVPTTLDSRLTDAAQRDAIAVRTERAVAAGNTACESLRGTAADLQVSSRVVMDDDPDALRAALEHCRLLVIGDRGDVGRRAFLIGTTSRELVRDVSCPVLVTPESSSPAVPTTTGGRHHLIAGAVLVGLDGTAADVPLLREAADEALRRDARLVVLHAYADDTRPQTGSALEAGRDRVGASLAAAALPKALHVTSVLTPDPPAAALLEHARSCALLVIGSRGPLALARLALGSVSREVLDAIRTPVLVVPRSRHAT